MRTLYRRNPHEAQNLAASIVARYGRRKGHRVLRDWFRLSPAREVRPLSEEDRVLYDRDYPGDYRDVYGFVIGSEHMTDDEVWEAVHAVEVHGDLLRDCTGLWCTSWLTWHRNPSGVVSYVHHQVMDL